MNTEGTGHDGRDDAEANGEGPEGTIPSSKDGIAAGAMDEPTHFEPEEDDGDGS